MSVPGFKTQCSCLLLELQSERPTQWLPARKLKSSDRGGFEWVLESLAQGKPFSH